VAAVLAFNVLNDICNEEGIDQIIENGGGWKPAMPIQIFKAKNKGFYVTVAPVVTKLEQSSLGADYRLVKDIEVNNNPRPVNKEAKEKAFSNLYGPDSNLVDKYLLFGGGKCGQENPDEKERDYFPNMEEKHRVDRVEIYNRGGLLEEFDTAGAANESAKNEMIKDIRQCIVGELDREYTEKEKSDRIVSIKTVHEAIQDGKLDKIKGFDKDEFYSGLNANELEQISLKNTYKGKVDTIREKAKSVIDNGIGKSTLKPAETPERTKDTVISRDKLKNEYPEKVDTTGEKAKFVIDNGIGKLTLKPARTPERTKGTVISRDNLEGEELNSSNFFKEKDDKEDRNKNTKWRERIKTNKNNNKRGNSKI
jgi:hypothetical protein